MDARLLDTNIVSYFAKADTRAYAYRPYCEGNLLCICPATLAELHRWPIVRNWGEHKTNELRTRLIEYTLLPADPETCWLWAEVVSMKGHPISYHDAWIAATPEPITSSPPGTNSPSSSQKTPSPPPPPTP